MITEQGYMLRIAGKDADAIGKKPVAASQVGEPASSEGPGGGRETGLGSVEDVL